MFVVGASSLGSEIAAARLLAPYFGASTIVWANTIAVVLVALSAGYWWGGRMADRSATTSGLGRLLLLAAAGLAAIPFAGRPFLDLAVEALQEISAGAAAGSLVAVLVLLAGPVFVLGAVTPYALKLALRRVEDAGTVSGRLYAISTVGSLTGTFMAALVLIPFAGTKRTFLLFALALAVVAVVQLGRRAAPVAAALVAALALPAGTLKPESARGEVIHERETTYQYARVVESGAGTRTLELNEGLAVHSIYRRGEYLNDGWWDDFLVLPTMLRGRAPERIAILGNAAGTTARSYGEFFPDTHVVGVELDGELSEIGRRYFELDGPNLELVTGDARPYLLKTDERFDAIFMDAYRQPYVPFYLATREFFELVRDRLTPDGMVLVNIGHPDGSDELERVMTATMGTVFHPVLRDAAGRRNTLLIAGAGSLDLSEAGLSVLPRPLLSTGTEALARIEPGLEGGEVYTDDRAPVEWLIDKSILSYASEQE